MAKVRAQFDTAGPLIGEPWPLEYRGTDDDAGRDAPRLRRTPLLGAALRPPAGHGGVPQRLGVRLRRPDARVSAERDLLPRARRRGVRLAPRSTRGAEIFKVHVQVGGFDVRDPLLDEVWGVLEDAGTPVVIHAGSGPVGTPYTGPGPVADLLRAHPRLRAGDRPSRRAGVRRVPRPDRDLRARARDTTMVFTTFFDELGAAFPPDLVPRLRDLQPKILLGSDFPQHPLPLRRAARRHSPASTSATTGCEPSAGTTASASSGNRVRDLGVVTRRMDVRQLNRGLIGFDLGREFQEKRVEKPTSSRKRSSETYKCQRKAH